MEAADIILMRSDLRDAVGAITLGKATLRNIKQNLFWALFYNTLGIPLAAGIFYPLFGWSLNPMFAAAAMSLSSVFVVTNALRLKRFTPPFSNSEGQSVPAREAIQEERSMEKKLMIEGMTCMHCVGRVDKALNAIDGVEAHVDLSSKSASVMLSKEVGDETLRKAVADAGYEVTDIKVGA
jgi:Cu+-exporting ATPase